MFKKATVLLIVFTLVVSFSMTAFASESECDDLDRAEVTREGNSITILTPAEPEAHAHGYFDNVVDDDEEELPGNGHGPNNPLYVAGE